MDIYVCVHFCHGFWNKNTCQKWGGFAFYSAGFTRRYEDVAPLGLTVLSNPKVFEITQTNSPLFLRGRWRGLKIGFIVLYVL